MQEVTSYKHMIELWSQVLSDVYAREERPTPSPLEMVT